MLQFFKTVLATLVGLILFTVVGAGGLALLVLIAANSESSIAKTRKKTVLVYDLATAVQDTPLGDRPFASQLGTETVSLRSLTQAIKAAAEDEKVVALYLKGGSGSAGTQGFAALSAIRTALGQFRSSGKPIYAYDTDWEETEFYLGSVATQVIVNPIGGLTWDGLSSEVRFYAGALEKYGVGIQVIRVGKFKSAVEPYLAKSLSPENREQTQGLLDSLWGDLLTAVAEHRPLSTDQLQAIANKGGSLTAAEALERQLVDQVAYGDEVDQTLGSLTDEPPDGEAFHGTPLRDYIALSRDATAGKKGKGSDQVALLYLEGEMVDGDRPQGAIGSTPTVQQLKELREDDAVKAVVLRINSPGGSATAASHIGREITLLAQEKPVVASFGDYAASGGYWIAAPAAKIFAEPGSITGSIGTYGLLPNIQKLANQNGVTWDFVQTAPFASNQTIARPKTPTELAHHQKKANDIYARFIDIVAEGRGLERAAIAQVAEGRVWSGRNAQALGLVDQLGNLEAAIAQAASLAELEADQWHVTEFPKPRSLDATLISEFFSEQPIESWHQAIASQLQRFPTPWAREWAAVEQDFTPLMYLSDPQGIYARLPFQLNIR